MTNIHNYESVNLKLASNSVFLKRYTKRQKYYVDVMAPKPLKLTFLFSTIYIKNSLNVLLLTLNNSKCTFPSTKCQL